MQKITVKVDSKYKLYPFKEQCCYIEGNVVYFYPNTEKEHFIGGFLDELLKLDVGKVYEITVKEKEIYQNG